MALSNGTPIPEHLPFESVSATDYEVLPQLGIVKAEIAGDALWTLPALSDGLIVQGAMLCVINPTAFQITLQAAVGDTIETYAGSSSALVVAAGAGAQLTTSPDSWVLATLLGSTASVDNAPGPGEPLVATSPSGTAIKRLQAGTNIELQSDADSVTVINGLVGNTSSSLTWLGLDGLPNLTSGIDNSGFGYQVLTSLTTGQRNTAFGAYSLYWNNTGSDNTAFGAQAMGWDAASLQSPTAFTNCTAVGSQTMLYQASGSNTTALGTNALRGLDPSVIAPGTNTCSNSVALGVEALAGVSSAVDSVATGYQALKNAGHSTRNVAGGYQTMLCDPAFVLANNLNSNTAHGYQALRPYSGAPVACTFTGNCAYGYQAMGNVDPTVTSSTALGYQALQNARANELTAFGYQALQNNTTGTGSTAFGHRALNALVTGNNNTAVGYQCLRSALGSDNTAVGYLAGGSLINGTGNVIMGSGADVGNSSHSNCIILGFGAVSTASNQLVLASVANPLGTSTTAGAAGTASALPALPALYLSAHINGVDYKIPLYN